MAAEPFTGSAAAIDRMRFSCQLALGRRDNFWHLDKRHASLCYESNSLIVGTIYPRLSSKAMRFGSTTNHSDVDVLRLTIRTSQNRSQRVFDLFRLPRSKP